MRHAGGKVLENVPDRDPRPANGRLAATDGRLDADALQIIHARRVRPYAIRIKGANPCKLAERTSEEAFLDFTGTYRVVSSPDMYFATGGRRRITLRQTGKCIKGEFDFDAQYGKINGNVHSDFIEFDFDGNDEWDEAFGEGEAAFEGDRLVFVLRYYRGDEFTFYCERP